MRRFVISKYKNYTPAKLEWTDFSEVGKKIGNKVFTLEEYIQVENSYINAINEILCRLNIDEIYIKDYTENSVKLKSYNGSVISIKDSNKLMRRILQNDLTHCIFYYPKKIRITFGFDYYMYITCNINKNVMTKILEKYNLYS